MCGRRRSRRAQRPPQAAAAQAAAPPCTLRKSIRNVFAYSQDRSTGFKIFCLPCVEAGGGTFAWTGVAACSRPSTVLTRFLCCPALPSPALPCPALRRPPYGSVLWSQVVQAEFYQPMSLTAFPFDSWDLLVRLNWGGFAS